tara:strand:+ start:224 stop:709 length:486 start_codon:yes stop_codon:yes gene_type:complete
MANLKKETYLKILFILSFTILITAYSIQYLLGYQPCSLCIIERIPYFLTIIIIILNYKFKKDQIFYSILLLLVFGFSFLVSIYHFGIEQGFIDETIVCGTKNAGFITKDEILKSFQEINISCKDVTFKIFNLSLTMYNMLVSILMFFVSMKVYFINNGNKK